MDRVAVAEAIGLVRAFLDKGGAPLDGVIDAEGFERNAAIVACKEAANENDRTRKRFEVMCREVFRRFRACINVQGVNSHRQDRDAVDVIYRSLQQDREQADISGILRGLQEVVDQAIDVQAGVGEGPMDPLDISGIDFERLKREFEGRPARGTTVQALKDAVEQRLRRLLARNPLRTDLQKHYEEIVDRYNHEKDRMIIQRTFEALLELVKKLSQEEQRAVLEGLSEEELAVFDLLKKPHLRPHQVERVKEISRELEATRAAVQVEVRDFLWSDETGLPRAYSEPEVDSRADDVFRHLYRAYPTVPSPLYASSAA